MQKFTYDCIHVIHAGTWMYASDIGSGYVYIIYPQKRTFTKIFLYINDFCICAIRPSWLHTRHTWWSHKLHILFAHRYILEVCSQKSPKQLVYVR
jgi:hypothetical protein